MPLVIAKKKAPSKSVIGLNEEIKNGDFAELLQPMRLTKDCSDPAPDPKW